MKTMAKILTLILALVLAFSFTAMTAAAEGETANPNVAKFTSKLSVTGSKNPNVTFEYTITGGSCISDTGDTSGYTELKDGYTEPVTIGTAAFTESDAETKQVEVDLSGTKFNVPGIYRYTITQTDPKVAGVTPDAKSVIYLDVYVTIEGSEGTQTLSFVFNTKESGAVNNTEEDRVYKVEGFENSFTSYSLSASKTVTGNQGDVNKYFKFTVKSALPEGYTYPYAAAYTVDISNADQNPTASASTTYTGMTNPASVTADELKTGVDFYLKNGQSIEIIGLPKGATYEVSEVSEGYTQDPEGAVSGTLDNESVSAAYTNNRGGTVPTGVMLGTASGIVLLAGGTLGAAMIKRRKNGED